MKKVILFCAVALGLALVVCRIDSTRAQSSLDSAETKDYMAAVIEPFTFGNVGYSPWTDWQDVIPVHVNPSVIPEVEAGRIDWNSIAGQARGHYGSLCSCGGWCSEIGLDDCGDHWNYDQFSAKAIDALGKASFEISHTTALHNWWNIGSHSGAGDDPEIYIVDLVVREGSTTFEPFNPAKGMLNSVTVRYNWGVAMAVSMYLNDEDFLCDAEGIGMGRTLITNWIGGTDFTDENADFRLTAQSSTGWQRNWMSGFSGLADWANSVGTGGAWYEILTEALLCTLKGDECLYESPDWGEYWSVPAKKSVEGSLILTPEEYRSLLSSDGLLRIYTSKVDYHEFWYEVEDWFDASQYGSRVMGSIAVEYNYTPSMPVVSIDGVVDELGHDLTAPGALALVDLVVEVEASFTNAGNVDPHTALIEWGDGTVDNLGAVTHAMRADHTYGSPGTYNIVLSVSDEYGNMGETAVQIEVVYPSNCIVEVARDLSLIIEDPALDPSARKYAQRAVNELLGNNGGRASNGALDKLEQGNLNAALVKIEQALKALEVAGANAPGDRLTYLESLLVLTAKSVAVDAIAQAEAVASKNSELKKIAQARDLMAEGDALLQATHYVEAMAQYRDALQQVQGMRLQGPTSQSRTDPASLARRAEPPIEHLR